MINFATENNLAQLVHFKTWSRTINGIRKESTLDHIYTSAILVADVASKVPTFGDHDLIIAKLKIKTLNSVATTCKRNWRNYRERADSNPGPPKRNELWRLPYPLHHGSFFGLVVILLQCRERAQNQSKIVQWRQLNYLSKKEWCRKFSGKRIKVAFIPQKTKITCNNKTPKKF